MHATKLSVFVFAFGCLAFSAGGSQTATNPAVPKTLDTKEVK